MRSILRRLAAGELTEAEALAEVRRVQLEELGGGARLDLGRPLRRGLPEVVLAEGKAPGDAARLAVSFAEQQGQGLVSRLSSSHWAALEEQAGGFELVAYGAAARVLRPGYVAESLAARAAVITAGTSDLEAALEARMMLEAGGVECRLVADVGVAGLHRLTGVLGEILAFEPDVLVVAAGMDGVLPGVVAGLVAIPVIGLPVSTGYGAGGAGEAALLTMLQSCATGLLTVNIDNGIGAGAAALLIAARVAAARQTPPAPAPRSPAPRSQPGTGSPRRS